MTQVFSNHTFSIHTIIPIPPFVLCRCSGVEITNMIKFIKYPIYVFELFTSTKSFRGNPIIGSKTLNRCGLHVIRMILSHAIMYARMWMLTSGISAEDRKKYFKEGYLEIENYLSDDDFIELEKECRNFEGEVREARQGNSLTQRAALSPDVLVNYPKIQALLFGKGYQRLARFTSGHLRDPLYYIEEIKNEYGKGGKDPQKMFHHDTFHPSMKSWLFIDDVSEDSGPFTYIPRSHKLNWKRIKWEYKMSCTAKDAKNGMHALGSSRYSAEDLRELDLPTPRVFAVKKNTLVIVNVFGIHKRGDSAGKSKRLALWGDSRTNPFIPLPGFGGEFVNTMQYHYLAFYRKKADDSARNRGVRSPWAVINSDKK